MQNNLAAKSRKMVTIIDPHIKRDGSYRVHKDAQSRDMYIKNTESKGGEYEGW
jgi:alpha 1,3-glucosidase